MERGQFSILIVDDEPSSRYALARALRASGFKTMEAASGAEALEFAEYVSAVILDIHLPDLLGWEVCRLLRARLSTSKLPIIHISARYTTKADEAQSQACGADEYFTAPYASEKIIEALDRLLVRR